MAFSTLALGAFIFASAGCSTAPKAPADSIAREILAAEGDLDVKTYAQNFYQSRHKVPIEINQNVQEWIEYFTVKDRERFHRFLKRGQIYKNVVQKILKENNVPRELYYLAMIESGFATHATSNAKAVGIWQFMRGTAVHYGLKTDRNADERRDPIRATQAAAKYLGNLHSMFGSWYLAMAGYNAGEYRIMGAIRRGNTRDFWELADKGILPRETMEYIPKFLAAVIIGRDPQKYGFHDIIPETVYPDVERFNVPPRTRLRDVARVTGLQTEELERLNPHLRHGVVPAGYRSYGVWVPKDTLSAINKRRTLAKKTLVASRSIARYRVRRGDTLIGISEKFGVSVDQLKRMNGLRRNHIYYGQSLRLTGDKI